MIYRELKELLERHNQLQVLKWWDELDAAGRQKLAGQIERVDWALLPLVKGHAVFPKGKVEPIDGLDLAAIAEGRERFRTLGLEALRAGKLACVLLAGGQGTRLGSDAPKGTFDIGLTKPLFIFEQLIRNLQEVVRACGVAVPLFIMTSEENDAQTQDFFRAHDYFGYPAQAVAFFRQEMAPVVGLDGKLLLSAKDSLALSPNGNGGWYSSLVRAGLAEEAEKRGVTWYNVFAVDNVLQRMADPVFLGATMESGRATGAKFVRKACPEERVGVLCLEDGRPGVIEYYEIGKELSELRDETGRLVYSFGVTLNYLFRADVLRTISAARLPVHVAKKKVLCLDEAGNLVEPQTENGCKFETLILDMIRCAGSCLPFEVEREKEFAPIKNRTGVDSVDTARELLRKNGVEL